MGSLLILASHLSIGNQSFFPNSGNGQHQNKHAQSIEQAPPDVDLQVPPAEEVHAGMRFRYGPQRGWRATLVWSAAFAPSNIADLTCVQFCVAREGAL